MMYGRETKEQIARYEGFPSPVADCAHVALMKYPTLLPVLAYNTSISDAIWLTLWGSKRPAVSIARPLVSRVLNADLRKHVIMHESRSTVIGDFVAYNVLTKDEQIALSALDNATSALLSAEWLDPSVKATLSVKAGGEALLELIALDDLNAYSPAYATKHILENMDMYASKHSKSVSRNLRIVFGKHPQVIDGVIAFAHGGVLTAIAGSANISESMCEAVAKYSCGVSTLTSTQVHENLYTYLALIANPRTPLPVVAALAKVSAGRSEITAAVRKRATKPSVSEPYSQISDPETLDRLILRACTSRGRDFYSPPRPVELLELRANANLSQAQRKLVDASVQDLPNQLLPADIRVAIVAGAEKVATNPTHKYPPFDDAADALRTNQQQWDIVVSMADEYEGTFADLVLLAQAI